jgi:hypothetical protein
VHAITEHRQRLFAIPESMEANSELKLTIFAASKERNGMVAHFGDSNE